MLICIITFILKYQSIIKNVNDYPNLVIISTASLVTMHSVDSNRPNKLIEHRLDLYIDKSNIAILIFIITH